MEKIINANVVVDTQATIEVGDKVWSYDNRQIIIIELECLARALNILNAMSKEPSLGHKVIKHTPVAHWTPNAELINK